MQDDTHTKTVLRDTALKNEGFILFYEQKMHGADETTESRPGKTKETPSHQPPPARQKPKILHSSNFASDLPSTSVTRKPKAAPRNTGTNSPAKER